MSFGIIVKNSFGDVCIDDKWVNYSLLVDSSIKCTGGSWETGQGNPTFPATSINIPVVRSLEPPILFVRHSPFFSGSPNPSTSGLSLWFCKVNGSPGSWSGFSLYFGGNFTRTLFYRVYAILPQSIGYGALVKRHDGEIAFDSGRKPLIVERVIQPSEWQMIYNEQAGSGFREQEWTIQKPSQEYISISTVNYFDGISNLANGRGFTYINGRYDSPSGFISHYHLFDSGTGTINPGPGSRATIQPMLCDAQ